MTFYSYVYDMVEEHLASKQLHPQRELIEVAVDWAFSNFFSTHPPYQRFPHDGESALDAFFRVSASKDKSHKVIISIQYGTNKTSLQHLYGNDSKGITDRLNLSLWLSSKGKEESPAIQIPETSSDDRSLARAREAALKRLEAEEKLEEYRKTLREGFVEDMEEHPYLIQKQIDVRALARDGIHLGIRLSKDGREIAFPAIGASGSIVAYHRIFSWLDDRGKHVKGNIGSISGAYLRVAGFQDPTAQYPKVAFAEGWASALAFYLITKIPTVCTFGASNAAKALKTYKERHPEFEEPVDAFDGDEAGAKASEEFASQWEDSMKKPVVKYNFGKGKDPADALKEGIEATTTTTTAPASSLVKEQDSKEKDSKEFLPPPISLEHFPTALRQYIQDGLRYKDIYKEKYSQYTMAVISMVSSIVGHRYYYGDGGTRTYGNEWIIYVAASGSGKSYSVDSGLEFLEQITARGKELFYGRKYEMDLMKKELKELEGIRSKVERIKDATLQAVERSRDDVRIKQREIESAEREVDFLRRYCAKLDDGSIEGIKANMAKTRGKLLFAEELADFWSNLQKSIGSKDPSTTLISLHKAQSREKDLVGGGVPMTINHPCLSLALITVPESLPECFGERHIGTGFLSRFMYSYDPSKGRKLSFSKFSAKKNPAPQKLEEILLKVYDNYIETAYSRKELTGRRNGQDREPVYLELFEASLGYQVEISGEAVDAANEFADDFLIPELSKLPEMWASAVSPRWQDHLRKLAMNFAVIRSEGKTSGVSIGREDILAASEVVRYSIFCERFCLSGIIKNSRIKERKTVAQNTEVVFGVIKRLIESKGVAKRSSVLNNSNLSGGAREMNTVIETLVEAKRIEEIKEGRNTFYKIVQDV
jgi:hypothetical protein